MAMPAPAEWNCYEVLINEVNALEHCVLQHVTVSMLNDRMATTTIPGLDVTTPPGCV